MVFYSMIYRNHYARVFFQYYAPMGVPLIISMFILKVINKKITGQEIKRDIILRHLVYVILYEINEVCIFHVDE